MRKYLSKHKQNILTSMVWYFVLITAILIVDNYNNIDWSYIFAKTGRAMVRLFFIQIAFLGVKDIISEKRNYLPRL